MNVLNKEVISHSARNSEVSSMVGTLAGDAALNLL